MRSAPGLAIVALVALSPLAARELELSGPVPTARYLPPGERSGPGWTVAATADNDGMVNTYRLESGYGAFAARGRRHAAVRGKEIEALAELERLSKSDVFVAAVKSSAFGSVETVKAFAAKPVETVQGLGGGAKRLLERSKLRAQEGAHDAKEFYDEKTGGEAETQEEKDRKAAAEELAQAQALEYLKISAAERRWYAELGVDPYTDNQPLRATIASYARIEGLTRFGMKFVGLPGIPYVGELSDAMKLVWATDPWDLRKRNRDFLLGIGLSTEAARRFEDNPWLSLTQQTRLVDALARLAGVAGREHLVARAADVVSREEARSLVDAIVLLVRAHGEGTPLAEILAGTRLPVARAADGALRAALVADAVFWTAEVAAAAEAFAAVYRPIAAPRREIELVGEASPLTARELDRLGWKLVTARPAAP